MGFYVTFKSESKNSNELKAAKAAVDGLINNVFELISYKDKTKISISISEIKSYINNYVTLKNIESTNVELMKDYLNQLESQMLSKKMETLDESQLDKMKTDINSNNNGLGKSVV